jgi:TIR domain
MHPSRLTSVASQARTLADAFAQTPTGNLGPQMQQMRALLGMYFHDGRLDPTIHEAIDDSKALGELTVATQWLLDKSGSLSGSDVPRVRERLGLVAVAIDRVAAVLIASSEGSGRGVRTMSAIRIFISHAAVDAKLAKALIDLIESGLDAPDGTIRCTSVDGYKLDGGDSAPDVLRDNLKGSAVVLGLLTKAGLASPYVLMELGAAWGFKTTAIPLLAPGVPFADLPGPFKEVHALRLDYEPDMAGFLATIGRRTGLPSRDNPAKIQAALKALTAAAVA